MAKGVSAQFRQLCFRCTLILHGEALIAASFEQLLATVLLQLDVVLGAGKLNSAIQQSKEKLHLESFMPPRTTSNLQATAYTRAGDTDALSVTPNRPADSPTPEYRSISASTWAVAPCVSDTVSVQLPEAHRRVRRGII